MKLNPDYEKAKELGLTQVDRWANGVDHHPMSMRLMEFLSEHDVNDYNDFFCWKMGGDGDNGESLMFEMDAFFEMLDGLNRRGTPLEGSMTIPHCPKCGRSDHMIKHGDEWVCHHTHRI
jgi:hypothetical protein